MEGSRDEDAAGGGGGVITTWGMSSRCNRGVRFPTRFLRRNVLWGWPVHPSSSPNSGAGGVFRPCPSGLWEKTNVAPRVRLRVRSWLRIVFGIEDIRILHFGPEVRFLAKNF